MRLRFGLSLGLAISATAGIVAVACGIEEGGVVDGADGSVLSDVQQTDAGGGPKDVSAVDTYLPPSCGDAAGCLPPVPANWQILTVLPDPDASCPNAFNQADLQTDPKLDLGACTCACADTSDAGCPAQVTLYYSGDPSCFNKGGPVQVVLDAGCTAAVDGRKDWSFGVKPAPATGLSCGAPTKTGSQNGTVTAVRVCQPTCNADFCGSVTNGTKACIMAPDDVPCPAPFNVKTLVGSAVAFGCNACPACTAKMANCALAVDMHGQDNCADNSQFSVSTNGTCTKWGGNNGWKSISATITPPTGPFCSYATQDPGGDAGFVGPRTICCTK